MCFGVYVPRPLQQCGYRDLSLQTLPMQAPAFNFPNESRRRFCADHKLEGMINLRKKRPRSELDLAAAVASQQPQASPPILLHRCASCIACHALKSYDASRYPAAAPRRVPFLAALLCSL